MADQLAPVRAALETGEVPLLVVDGAPDADAELRHVLELLAEEFDRLVILSVHADAVPGVRETATGWEVGLPVSVRAGASPGRLVDAVRGALERRADLVHVAPWVVSFNALPLAMAVTQVLAKPQRHVVIEVAPTEALHRRGRVLDYWFRRAVERTAAWILPTDERRRLISRWTPRARCMAVIGRPVEVSGLPRRAEPPTALDRWLIVDPTDLDEVLDRLLPALADRVAAGRDARLSVPVELSEVAAGWVDRLGLRDRVHPVSPAADPAALIAEHDVTLQLTKPADSSVIPIESLLIGTPLVVTGGVTEELSEAIRLGMAHRVVWDADATEILAALDVLEKGLPEADPELTAALLTARFDRPVVRAALGRQIRGLPEPTPGRPGLQVLALAGDDKEARAAERSLWLLARYGGWGTYATTAPPASVPAEVRVVDLSAARNRVLWGPIVRVVRTPGDLAIGAGRLAVGRVSHLTGRRLTGTQVQLDRVARHYDKLWSRLRERLERRWWKGLKTIVTRRAVERAGLLPDLLAQPPDLVIMPDQSGTSIVRLLLRARPDLETVRQVRPGSAAKRSVDQARAHGLSPDA